MSTAPRISRDLVEQALRARDGNVSAVAEDLGISRRGLYDRLQAFGINPAHYRVVSGVTFSASGVTATGDFTPDCTVSSGVKPEPDVHASWIEKWQDSPAGHKFGSIMREVGQTVGAAVSGAAEDFSAAVSRKVQATPRLKRNHLQFFNTVRRQYNAENDLDLNISDIMEMFVNRYGDRFAREILGRREIKPAPALPAIPSEEKE